MSHANGWHTNVPLIEKSAVVLHRTTINGTRAPTVNLLTSSFCCSYFLSFVSHSKFVLVLALFSEFSSSCTWLKRVYSGKRRRKKLTNLTSRFHLNNLFINFSWFLDAISTRNLQAIGTLADRVPWMSAAVWGTKRKHCNFDWWRDDSWYEFRISALPIF